MIDLKKYSVKEVVAAIKVVEEILDVEDFLIDVRTGTVADAWRMSDESLVNKEIFSLIDRQAAYLGDIDRDRFNNLSSIIARTDNYHNDSFYYDYEERIDAGEVIPQDDWDRKILIFLESGYCQDLLQVIDVETYLKFKDKNFEDIGLNSGEIERYVKDGVFDAVGYLCDKSIAMAILETESAYLWFEHDGKFYLSEYGLDDIYKSNEGFKTEVLRALKDETFNKLTGPGGFEPCWTVYDAYSQVINSEFGQIQEDMRDIGLYDDKDDWGFYLTEYELEYIGLGEELEKVKFQLDTEDMLIGLEEGEEKRVDELIADVVKRSKETGYPGKNDVEFEK